MSVIISIIVPVYNVEQYLNRCVTSLVNQTLKDIEILLVDDGSPDSCPQMCDEWAERDSRIRVVHKKNEGLGYARNSGMDLARGEYIAFVDSDDYVNENTYKKLYEQTEQGKFDIVYCGHRCEYEKGLWKNVRDFEDERTFIGMDAVNVSKAFLVKENGLPRLTLSVWHSIYRRDLVKSIRFNSERNVCSEDVPFQVEVTRKAQAIKFIPDCFYNYCLNGGSLTHNNIDKKFFQYTHLVEVLKQLMPPCEYCCIYSFFFHFTVSIVRRIIFNVSISPRERNLFFLTMLRHPIWKEVKLDIKSLYREYKVYYWIVKHHMPLCALKCFAAFDVFVICNKFKIN